MAGAGSRRGLEPEKQGPFEADTVREKEFSVDRYIGVKMCVGSRWEVVSGSVVGCVRGMIIEGEGV